MMEQAEDALQLNRLSVQYVDQFLRGQNRNIFQIMNFV